MLRKVGFITFILLSSCVATDVGNPQIETEIEVVGYENEAPELPTAITLANGLEITAAFIKLKRFHLDTSENCNDTTADFEGVVLVDLLDGQTSGEVRIDKDAGAFCRLRLQITDEVFDGEPADLVGNSVSVIGTRLDGTAFSVNVPIVDELSLNGEFTLDEGSHLLQVGFFLNEWITDEMLATDPVIDANHPEFETFRTNVSTSARLFHDANQDGVLDDEEIAISLASTNE